VSRSRRDTHSLLLAGWLFADLLAMLFVISLASQTQGAAAAGDPSQSASQSPSPGNSEHSSPSPGTKPSTGPNPPTSAEAAKIGLDPHWQQVNVTDINYDELRRQGPDGPMAKKIVDQMTAALKDRPGGGRQVGLVATFTQTPNNPDRGDKMSALVDAALTKNHPQFKGAADLPLWQAGSEGTVQVKVFFFNQ
jgi:hypothetical protein